MKKKLLAILVAATCLASILVFPVPASATDPNEEGLTVAENFSGSKINHNCALEFSSFITDRQGNSPVFEEVNGSIALKTANYTAWPDYLKVDMKDNTLEYVTGKIAVNNADRQWMITYKKDASDKYSIIAPRHAYTNDVAYNTASVNYAKSRLDFGYTQKRFSDTIALGDGGKKFDVNSFANNYILNFKISYNYSENTVTIVWSNDTDKWTLTHIETLAEGETPVCMFTSQAQSNMSYLSDITVKYSDKNTANHKMEYSHDENSHYGMCDCGLKTSETPHFVADTVVENGVVKFLCVCGYEMKSATVKENGFTEDFAGGKLNNTKYLKLDRLDNHKDSINGPRYAFYDVNGDGSKYYLRGGSYANYAPYLGVAMNDNIVDGKELGNKLSSLSGRIHVNTERSQWALTFKKDSSGNYHMFALTTYQNNTLKLAYISNTALASDDDSAKNWQARDISINGTSSVSDKDNAPTATLMNKGMYYDFKMEYDYSANTVNFTWYNDELGWKFTHTEKLSTGDTPVCMLTSRTAQPDKKSFIESVSAVYESSVSPSIEGASLTDDDGIIDENDQLDLYFYVKNPNGEVTGYKITQSGAVMMLKNKYDTNGNELYIGVKGSVEAKTDEFYENYSAILLGSRAKVPGHKIAARPYVVYTSETDPSDSFVCYGDVYDAHSVYSCFSAIQKKGEE